MNENACVYKTYISVKNNAINVCVKNVLLLFQKSKEGAVMVPPDIEKRIEEFARKIHCPIVRCGQVQAFRKAIYFGYSLAQEKIENIQKAFEYTRLTKAEFDAKTWEVYKLKKELGEAIELIKRLDGKIHCCGDRGMNGREEQELIDDFLHEASEKRGW